MLDPLHRQRLALTAKPTAVFVLGRRRSDHRAHTRLGALICQKRTKQRLTVDPVSFCSPAPTRRRDRSRIDNVALNPLVLQNAVNPKAVQSRFLNDNDRLWYSDFLGERSCLRFSCLGVRRLLLALQPAKTISPSTKKAAGIQGIPLDR